MGSVFDLYLDNKFDWLGLAYGLVCPIIVACGQIQYDKIEKPMKNMMKIVLETGSSWPWCNLIEMGREAGKLKEWGIVGSIFEMD